MLLQSQLQDFLRRSTTPSKSLLALKDSLKWARRTEKGLLVLPSSGADCMRLVRTLCPGMVEVELGSLLREPQQNRHTNVYGGSGSACVSHARGADPLSAPLKDVLAFLPLEFQAEKQYQHD